MTAIPAGASLEVDVSAPVMRGTFYAYVTDDSSGDVLGYAALGGQQGYTRVAFGSESASATLSVVIGPQSGLVLSNPPFGMGGGKATPLEGGMIVVTLISTPKDTVELRDVVSTVCNGEHYRYGYNGQMKDNEWAGVGNHNTALFWEYDTRTGRRANQDPKGTVWESPYLTFGDNPIENVDPLGDKIFHYNAVKDANGNTTLQLANVETVYKNVIVGYVYNVHSPSGRSPIYQTVEDTKDRYVVATQKYVYTDAGTGNRRVDYTTESTYDSYDEAYANRDHPNDMIGPFLVGLASMAHAHRMGETFGGRGAGGGSSVSPGEEPEGVIYRRTDKTGKIKPYIGQAKSMERYLLRQQEHARANPDADFEFEIIDRAVPGKALDQAEQRHINANGGPTNKSNPNGRLSNKKNQIKQQ
jgi:hypothetical protein